MTVLKLLVFWIMGATVGFLIGSSRVETKYLTVYPTLPYKYDVYHKDTSVLLEGSYDIILRDGEGVAIQKSVYRL